MTKARAVLAQKNREAKKRVAVAEPKLLEKEFALKRRMARSVTETAAFLETQREKVVAREGQVASREDAIDRRGEAVEQLVREARAYDIDLPKNEAAASPFGPQRARGRADGRDRARPEDGGRARRRDRRGSERRGRRRRGGGERNPGRGAPRVAAARGAAVARSARFFGRRQKMIRRKEADEQQQKSSSARARWKRSIRKVGGVHTGGGFRPTPGVKARWPGVAEALDFSAIISTSASST